MLTVNSFLALSLVHSNNVIISFNSHFMGTWFWKSSDFNFDMHSESSNLSWYGKIFGLAWRETPFKDFF